MYNENAPPHEDEEVIDVYRCQDCAWEGDVQDLVDENDNGKFDQCPRCGKTEFDVDEEERGYFY